MFQLKKLYVASGNYFISQDSSLMLQAILGTCVGVAIYDAENGVGGIIHILLPKPTSLTMELIPARYASTGMPLFIKDLIAAGAKIETMKAVIAGGALVGPISEQDLALDIGGQAVDIVRDILVKYKISIEMSETGGFFTCCLNLNLKDGGINIEPAGFDKLLLGKPPALPDKKSMENAIEKILPIPQVALKVMRMIDEENTSPAMLAEEVQKDQVLSARTLKLCNSAMFGVRNRIESLKDALVLLGKNTFVQLVLSAAVKNYFNQTGVGYSICKGGLYHHAVGTAWVAQKLAACTGKAVPTLAYIAGLLHDIGKVVLDQFINATYPFLYRDFPDKKDSMLEIEKKVIGMDHTEIGGLLAKKWAFPDMLVDSIQNHHKPENSSTHKHLTDIVYIADLLMYRFNAGLELERLKVNRLYSCMEELGLEQSQVPEIIDMIPSQIFNAAA